MQDNIINLELDSEILNKVQNKIESLINEDNYVKVENENISLLAFEKYLRSIMQDIDTISIPNSLENETSSRRELFNLNYLKVNNQYVNVIPVLDPSKKEFFIPKNIFDSLHHADTFSFIYITPLKTSAYLLGYLTYDDIDSNKISFDNHFYKLNISNLKTNIQDLLNISTSRTISDSINNQEKNLIEVDLKKQLNELNSFRNDNFVDELYYQPTNYIQKFLKYDSLSKIYLEAQNVFQENMQLKNFYFASDLANSLYEHYKNNKNNFENLIDNNFDNSSIRYFNNLLITELENIKDIFRSISKSYRNIDLNNFDNLAKFFNTINFSKNKDFFVSLLENILDITKNTSLVNNINLDKLSNKIDYIKNNKVDLKFILNVVKEQLEFNFASELSKVESTKSQFRKENSKFDIVEDLINESKDETYIELKSIFVLIIKVLVSKGYLKNFSKLNNIQIACIIDSVFFVTSLLNNNKLSIKDILSQIVKRNLSIILTYISKKLEVDINLSLDSIIKDIINILRNTSLLLSVVSIYYPNANKISQVLDYTLKALDLIKVDNINTQNTNKNTLDNNN